MSVKLLSEHNLEFLSLKGGCTGSSESILVKIPLCWKSHVVAQILYFHRFADAYPSEPPVIAVRSEALSDEDIEDLTTYLTQTAQPQANTFKTLEDLVNHAVDWLKEEHISLKGKKVSPHNSPNKQFKKKGKKPKKKFVDKEEKPKKPPMKTAIDVVKRIQWDKTLPIDQFIVGYIDRMEGLKEKYFTAFSWEDIASVDYTVLAIPKHRIQYFKYKTEIVWDKGID